MDVNSAADRLRDSAERLIKLLSNFTTNDVRELRRSTMSVKDDIELFRKAIAPIPNQAKGQQVMFNDFDLDKIPKAP